ncbi:MAG: trypsin-like peptidase domain-containing protein [Janthinobacterium lividum]
MALNSRSDDGLEQRIRRRLTPITTFTTLGALSAVILAGSLLTGQVSGKEAQHVDSSDARPLVIPSPANLSNGFSAIAKQVGPAVVNINTESTPKQQQQTPGRRNRRGTPEGPVPNTPNGGGGGDEDGNNMQDFFNRFFGGGGGAGGQQDLSTRRALGSGFIVDPRGYIITNNHVIDKADHIYVKLSTDPEGSSDQGRPAKVIGADPATDIAVIKIETAQPLPTIKLGNSTGAQVGDWVLAIGSPFGLSKTVSAGIVSAINRAGSDLEQGGEGGIDQSSFQKFIQTDAAINPGNSGGPLVDMAGEVIGMNTAIYTSAAGSEGVGFALPSNLLATVYNQLIGPSHMVTRGSIGIQFQAAQSSAVGRVYGFTSGGVIVNAVTPNGPAAKAGLQPKDVILSVDGQAIKDGDTLISIVSQKAPGSTVRLGYLRNGQRQTAEVGIADRSKLFSSQSADEESSSPAQPDAGQAKLGITEQPTKPENASKLGIHGGVTITAVRPGSFAEDIGLAPGAVIVEINRRPITSESEYRNIVSGLKNGDDIVFVIRDPRNPTGGDNYLGGTLQ